VSRLSFESFSQATTGNLPHEYRSQLTKGAALSRARNYSTSGQLPRVSKHFNGAALNLCRISCKPGIRFDWVTSIAFARIYWRSNQLFGLGRVAVTVKRTLDPLRTASKASNRKSFPITLPQQSALISSEPVFGFFRAFNFDTHRSKSREEICCNTKWSS
jgi:hypothetical protein